jgi:hypothetical protein
MGINGYSIDAYWFFYFIKAIDGYFRLNYHRLLITIGGYFIKNYW